MQYCGEEAAQQATVRSIEQHWTLQETYQQQQ
jgi:hypothetical protein